MEHVVKAKANINAEIFRKDTGWDLVARDGVLTVVGDCTEAEALAAYAAHDPKPLTVEEKLAIAGLSIDDLKAALGL
jgi:hypothetical protein